MDDIHQAIKSAIDYLGAWEVKTFDFFLRVLRSSVRKVYNGDMGGDFIDIIANLLQGQLTQAWRNGLRDANYKPDEASDAEIEKIILREFDHVDGYYRDIVDARVDGAPLEPLLARAEIWANRYDDVYNQAVLFATPETTPSGDPQNLIWKYNPEKEHCDECASLNGIIATFTEWKESGYHPYADWDGNLPNESLGCGGWRCGCELTPTDEPRNVPEGVALSDYIAERLPPKD